MGSTSYNKCEPLDGCLLVAEGILFGAPILPVDSPECAREPCVSASCHLAATGRQWPKATED